MNKIDKNVRLYSTYCKCGFKLQAFLADTEESAIRTGFPYHTYLTCPICKQECYI